MARAAVRTCDTSPVVGRVREVRWSLDEARGPGQARQAWLSLGGRLTLGHHARRSPEEVELGPGGPLEQPEVARARRTLARLIARRAAPRARRALELVGELALRLIVEPG